MQFVEVVMGKLVPTGIIDHLHHSISNIMSFVGLGLNCLLIFPIPSRISCAKKFITQGKQRLFCTWMRVITVEPCTERCPVLDRKVFCLCTRRNRLQSMQFKHSITYGKWLLGDGYNDTIRRIAGSKVSGLLDLLDRFTDHIKRNTFKIVLFLDFLPNFSVEQIKVGLPALRCLHVHSSNETTLQAFVFTKGTVVVFRLQVQIFLIKWHQYVQFCRDIARKMIRVRHILRYKLVNICSTALFEFIDIQIFAMVENTFPRQFVQAIV